MSIKDNIKTQRNKAGFTQTALAEKMEVGRSTIARYESGEITPPIEKLELMATILNCSIVDLIDRSAFENAAPADRRKVLDIAFDEAKTSVNRASDIASAAGYIWTLPDKEDGFIHLVDKKTNIEFAVPDEAFTAAVDSSGDFIDFNFKKMMESAKIIDNDK